MKQQQDKFRHDFVASLVGPTAEANDRTLFILDPLFTVPGLMSGDGNMLAY